MYNSSHIGTHLVDGRVHQNFASAVSIALDLISIQIADNQVLRIHHPLADASWSRKNPVGAQSDTNVPVVRGDPALLVGQVSELYDLPARILFFAGHAEA